MSSGVKTDLKAFNDFCGNLREGAVLYNVDSTNLWGEFLLVVNITTVVIERKRTYAVLMIGLKKDEGKFIPKNLRIKLTPDYAPNIPFLKYVGHCNFQLIPDLKDVNVNLGLVTVYSNIDLWKYKEKLATRKPRRRKYGKDGKLIIKKAENE